MSACSTSFSSGICRTQKVKQVGVFEYLRCHVGIGRRQGGRKVGYGLSFTVMGSILDLHGKNTVGPPVCYRFSGVPQTLLRIIEFFEQCDIVVPGNLCENLLHNPALRPSRCKGTHVFEVAWGEASHVGKRLPKVC